MKYEDVYLREYTSPRDTRLRLGQDLRQYNEQRPHSALNYHTPAAVDFGTSNSLQPLER